MNKLTREVERFRFHTHYYFHQDKLGWSRTQALIAVEGAVVAGAFAIKGLLAAVVLVVGTVLVFEVRQLIKRDWQIRKHHQEEFLQILPDARLEASAGRWRSGSFILDLLVGIIIGTNVLLMIGFCSRIRVEEINVLKWFMGQ